MNARGSVLRAARRAGLEEQVRAVRRAQVRAKWWARGRTRALDATVRRNARDERNLRVLLAALLHCRSNCVDVGANRGHVLAEVERLAPEGRHIAFEPLPDLARELAREHPAVDVRAVALSNRSGESGFTRVSDAPGLSGFGDGRAAGRRRERITVRVEPLDAALPHDFAPDLIKVDVEGAELQVFEGARETLRRHRPVVVFEHSNRLAPQLGATPADVHRLLSDCGLRMFDMDGAGPLSVAEFQRVFDSHRRFNFFARAA